MADETFGGCSAMVVLMPTDPTRDDMPLTGQELKYGCKRPGGHEGPHDADQQWMWTDEKTAFNFYAVTYAPGEYEQQSRK